MARAWVRPDIRVEYIIANEWSWTREPSRLVGQRLQWGAEKRGIQSISADVVEERIVSGGFGSAGCPSRVPFKCERTVLASSTEEPRAQISKG